MVLVPGDSLALAPAAAAGNVTKTGHDVKRDIERKLPPLPWDFKPVALGLPNPEDVFLEINARVREIMAIPQRIIESGGLPPPHQLLRIAKAEKPLETVREHTKTIPTPYSIVKSSPLGRDLPPNPRDFLADAERAVEDLHNLMDEGRKFAETEIPVMVENGKEFHANVTAARHIAVEMGQAGAKSALRISKSVSKLMDEFAEGGLPGLIF